MKRATRAQRELIKAYGWKVPVNCSTAKAGAIINTARERGLNPSAEYCEKMNALRAKAQEEQAADEAKWAKQHARDMGEPPVVRRKKGWLW